MSISSATSTAVATRQWKYDVFLNFRGDDVRWTLVSHLCDALRREKLVTIIDEDMMRGKDNLPELLKIIGESNVVVAIFSKDYASSPWCLRELVKIIECHNDKDNGQTVIPVFHHVSSHDVRKQSGIYAEAFARHENDPDNASYVPEWKAAMTKAANITGRSAGKARSESELVKAIVDDILVTLGRTSDGMESVVQTGSGVPKSLSVKVANTRTVEIQMPGGQGTTESEDLPVDHLVSLLEPLQQLAEASLQSSENSSEAGQLKQLVQGFPVRNHAAFGEACGDTTYALCPKRRPAASKCLMPSSSSTKSPAAQRWEYDVFLSFRGKDTHRKFITHLYGALCRNALETFIDDQLLRGEEITPALFNAIEGSKVAVIIFSTGYVSSAWCLEELVKIIECHETQGLGVIPVFYHVDPSSVREQIGIVEKSLEKVLRWKAALARAANFAGWYLPVTGSESKLVKAIVDDILITLGRTSDGMDRAVETRSRVPKSLSVKVAHTRTVEIQVPRCLRMAKYEDLPIDHLVSLLEPLQHLSQESLQSLENSHKVGNLKQQVQGFLVRNRAAFCCW